MSNLVQTWLDHSPWGDIDDSWKECDIQFERFSNAWGLKDAESTECKTIQGINYTQATTRKYAMAWSVDKLWLSKKIPGSGKCEAIFDTHSIYPTTLVFCGGPNAQKPSKHCAPTSSMRRTYSAEANRDRKFLEAGAAWAVYAALHASAKDGCDVALIPFVSGGLYAGPWRNQPDLLDTFTKNIERMLMHGIMPDGTEVQRLGNCFKNVIVVVLKK